MYRCLLIDSEYCSMGRWISVIVADHLQMKFYEGKDLLCLADEEWLTVDFLQAFDTRIASMSTKQIQADMEFQKVHKAFTKAIKKAVELGPCIIHERAAADILRGHTDFLNVMLYNSGKERKIPRAKLDGNLHLENTDDASVMQAIVNEDNKRRAYHDAVSRSPWGMKEGYTLCLDSEQIGREKCAEILIEAMKNTRLNAEKCKKIILKSFEKVL